MSYKLDLEVTQWGKGINKNVDRNSDWSTKIGNASVQIDMCSYTIDSSPFTSYDER